MCTGGELLADFRAGTCERPDVPDIVAESLTTTADGEWVVWAHKIAHSVGDRYVPMTGGEPYPADAVATCRMGFRHRAPDPGCTCGFHALSQPWPFFPSLRVATLEVMLSGRVLAFEWAQGGILLRGARQTVLRVVRDRQARARTIAASGSRRPDDPDGRLAMNLGMDPRGAGPVRLRLPSAAPTRVAVSEHAGYCRQPQPAPRPVGRPFPGAVLTTV